MTKVLILISLLFPLFLKAQEENWDAYIAQYEKGPGSTLINMTAKQTAPVKNLTFLLTTGVTFKDCTVEGLPPANNISNLYNISDSVKATVDRKIKNNRLVGTFTYQCQRFDYFYLQDTAGLRRELTILYAKRFPDYIPFINIKTDSNWNTYLNFLYPKEDIFEYMQDEKVVMQLQKTGDNLNKERQIDHWLYFSTDADRKCIFPYLAQANFIIESFDKTDRPEYSYSLHISRKDKTDITSISRITKTLRIQAKKCNGIYDGWEAPVVK